MEKCVKLSTYAKNMGISYKTALVWFSQGKIVNAFKTDSGSIFIREKSSEEREGVVIYARVSSPSRRKEIAYQVDRLSDYANARGYAVTKVYKEVASGMNDTRRELWKMLDSKPKIILIENKDRLTRFGYNYLERLLADSGTSIECVNVNDDDEKDLIKDMVAIMTSFCCRLYGLRRGMNKAKDVKKIVETE